MAMQTKAVPRPVSRGSIGIGGKPKTTAQLRVNKKGVGTINIDLPRGADIKQTESIMKSLSGTDVSAKMFPEQKRIFKTSALGKIQKLRNDIGTSKGTKKAWKIKKLHEAEKKMEEAKKLPRGTEKLAKYKEAKQIANEGRFKKPSKGFTASELGKRGAKKIGPTGFMWIGAGVAGYIVYSRLKDSVDEWNPGDIVDALMEDPLLLVLILGIIAVIIWYFFGRK